MLNMARKFLLFGVGILFLACGGSPAPVSAVPPSADELDAAIRETSNYLNQQLPKGNKLVILNIQSEYPALSEYIIDELIANTVNDRIFSVVDRRQLDTIRAELDFQYSGEVDDDTMQELGRIAGAQIIISGAVSKIGDLYRLRIRALSVQSASIEGQFNRNIPEGTTIADLVRSRATGYGESSGRPTASASSQTSTASTAGGGGISTSPTPAPAVTPALVPANGTYTFFPRLRAWRGANNVDAYLDRIVVRNGYLTVYLKGTASGDDKDGYRFMNFSHWQYNNPHMDERWWINWGDHGLIKEYMNKVLLQDMDNPSKSYKAMDVGKAEDGGRYYSFQNVQGTKFKLTDGNNPPNFFEEIVLKNPDN